MTFSGLTLLAVLVACRYSGCHDNDGHMISIAQPGSNLVLSCPHGQEINIMETRASPPGFREGMPTYCESIKGPECLKESFLTWSKSVCDNLQECRLPKPNKKMLTCKKDKPDTVSAFYHCENKFPDKQIAIACEGENARLKCEKGRIHIIKFNYGRLDMNTCTNKTSMMTYCTDRTDSAMVKHICEGQKSCVIPAIAREMPLTFHCDHNPKYVYVSYVCEE